MQASMNDPYPETKIFPGRESEVTVIDFLRHLTQNRPTQRVYMWLDDQGKEVDSLTYSQLWDRCMIIANQLKEKGAQFEMRMRLTFFEGFKDQDCVLVAHPPGLEFMCAFFGCLLANVIAVPAYPVQPAAFQDQIKIVQAFLKNANAKYILTSKEYIDRLKKYAGAKWDQLTSAVGDIWLITDEWKTLPTNVKEYQEVINFSLNNTCSSYMSSYCQ